MRQLVKVKKNSLGRTGWRDLVNTVGVEPDGTEDRAFKARLHFF